MRWKQLPSLHFKPIRRTGPEVVNDRSAVGVALAACFALSLRIPCYISVSRVVEAFRREYNEDRPHSALGNLTPAEFVTLAELPTVRSAGFERHCDLPMDNSCLVTQPTVEVQLQTHPDSLSNRSC